MIANMGEDGQNNGSADGRDPCRKTTREGGREGEGLSSQQLPPNWEETKVAPESCCSAARTLASECKRSLESSMAEKVERRLSSLLHTSLQLRA